MTLRVTRFLSLVIIILCAPGLRAQSSSKKTATGIQGTVLGANGKPVPSAAVTVTLLGLLLKAAEPMVPAISPVLELMPSPAGRLLALKVSDRLAASLPRTCNDTLSPARPSWLPGSASSASVILSGASAFYCCQHANDIGGSSRASAALPSRNGPLILAIMLDQVEAIKDCSSSARLTGRLL